MLRMAACEWITPDRLDRFGCQTPITGGGLVVAPPENNRRAQALRVLVATLPPAGTNIVLVSHKPNIVDPFGSDWFDVREGEASISSPTAVVAMPWLRAFRPRTGRSWRRRHSDAAGTLTGWQLDRRPRRFQVLLLGI